MSLSRAEFATVTTILEKIDAGLASPRISGHVGLYLRQYEKSRHILDDILIANRVKRREDGAISGNELSAVNVHLLSNTRAIQRGPKFGDVVEALALSNELASVTNIALWLNANTAAKAAAMLAEGTRSLTLNGDYRWTPPSRITSGEARVAESDKVVTWQNASFLKAVAEDIRRSPHAMEYVLDSAIGARGLKYFRTVCVVLQDDTWYALPALGAPRIVDLIDWRQPADLKNGSIHQLLIYREPWSSGWAVAANEPVDANRAFEHALGWVSFQLSLEDESVDSPMVQSVYESLCNAGAAEVTQPECVITSAAQAIPLARAITRWLRGLATV